MILTKEQIGEFGEYLRREEKSKATQEKYLRDVKAFCEFAAGAEITKELVADWKRHLAEQNYAVRSINSMLASMNSLLDFLDRADCKVKSLRIQRQIFVNEDRELTRQEYQAMVKAAGHTRLSGILQTICGTGIRVSELAFITVRAVMEGKAVVACKNKTRVIFIPMPLRQMLREYIREAGIKAGPVFVTRSGRPVNRSNVWRDMQKLCRLAGVSPKKVFPHNLRHLFARTFYEIEKDIVHLADLLGHSSVNTTRIYTMETGKRHRQQLEQVQKILTT